MKSASLVFAMAFLVTVPAYAQQKADSSAVNNNTVYAISGAGGSGSGGGSSRIVSSGHLYTTPSVVSAGFQGANPCLIGVGGSAAGGPVGLSLTIGRNDEGCQRRSDAAAWHALGFDAVSISRMCQDDDNLKAYEAATGNLCPGHVVKKPEEHYTASWLSGIFGGSDEKTSEVTTATPPIVVAAADSTIVTKHAKKHPAFCALPGLNIETYPECR